MATRSPQSNLAFTVPVKPPQSSLAFTVPVKPPQHQRAPLNLTHGGACGIRHHRARPACLILFQPLHGPAYNRGSYWHFCQKRVGGYPDFSVELISMGETGGGLVAFQWVVRGTNTGPGLDGTPATGRAIKLPGATFFQVQGDKIRSEYVYHDRQTIAEQQGLKATKD